MYRLKKVHVIGLFLRYSSVASRSLSRGEGILYRNITMELLQPCTKHYDGATMSLMASQITSLTVVYSTVYSDADQRKHQSSASLAFVWGIHRDRWIPRTKGQLRGICFHLMTSSWTISIIKKIHQWQMVAQVSNSLVTCELILCLHFRWDKTLPTLQVIK